jgi:hypothetical protein
MGTDPVKWSPALEKPAICESVCPFFVPGTAYGYSICTIADQVGKSLRLAQRISSLGCPTPSGIHLGPNAALKYPNAHQVAKNDRAGAKKFHLSKIYMPELTALTVAPRIRSAWVITALWVRWRAGAGNRLAIVAIPI